MSQPTTRRQPWHGECCGMSGVVEYAPGTGVYAVFRAILRDHADRAPDCEGDRYTIRLGEKPADKRQ